MNDLGAFDHVFDGLSPFAGPVPPGFLVNFLGGLTDANFRVIWGVDPTSAGGCDVATSLPVVEDGRLVGIVTEHDFIDVAARLLEDHLRESEGPPQR